MNLLFDENPSPTLVGRLADLHPSSSHGSQAAFRGASDEAVWEYAKAQTFVVVSRDSDFRDRSALKRAPPKVIWLDVGSAGTDAIAELLRKEHQRGLPRCRQWKLSSVRGRRPLFKGWRAQGPCAAANL